MKQNSDYSALVQSETNIFQQNIDILRLFRKTLWDSKGNSSFLISHLYDIYEMKENLSKFRQYVSSKIYEKFIEEYEMTMLLIQKFLIKSINEHFLPHGGDEQIKIEELIFKIENMLQEKGDITNIVLALKQEDPSTRKILESLGLSDLKIEEIISSGYVVESILDITLNSELRK